MLTFGLRRKPLKMFCEHCGKFIPSDMEWICGYCNMENLRTKSYSFLHKCEQCRRTPKSFHCPHCNRISFFDETHDDRHPARSTHQPVSVPAVIDTDEQIRAQKVKEREERKAELEYEIVCAKLDNDLAALLKQRELYKSKTPKELLVEDLERDKAQCMGADEVAEQDIKAYEKLYAGNPDLLEKHMLFVKKWRSKHI